MPESQTRESVRMAGKAAAGLLGDLEAHYDELLRFLARRTGDLYRAEDVAQEVWLRVASSDAGAVVDNPRAYLFRVAANLATDFERHEGRLADRRASEALARTMPDPMACPERRRLARERIAALDGALAELPDNARRALLMSRAEGRTFAAIAAELGVSESMVAKYIARALRACRDRLRALDLE